MQASERIVYGRAFKPTPLWLWIAQRASGVLLGPLVLLHMASTTLAASAGLNALLLGAILVHGYSGLRRLRVESQRFGLMVAAAVAWCSIVAVFGGMLILYR